MWFHTRLEEVERLWTITVWRNLLTTSIMNLRHLVNERNNITQELHQTTNTHALTCTYAENREDRTGNKTLTNTCTQLIFCQCFLFKELLHQALIILGSSLNECFMKFHSLIHLVSRNVLNNRFATFWLPTVFLHQQNINQTVETRTCFDRILYRNTL